MRMSVQRKHRLVRFERALETRTAQEREDGFGFADDGFLDGRIVSDGDFLLRLALRQAVVELDGFPLRNLNKGLNSLLSKRHELIRSKATAKALGAGESDVVDVVALTVEQ